MADEQPADIGSVIKAQLANSIKNLDILSLLQKVVAQTPEDEESDEVREKLQGVIDKYNDMTDSDKEAFASQLKEMLASKLAMKLKDQNLNLSGLQEAIGKEIMYQFVYLIIGVVILVILMVFFGYKLYKSIKDKELKREEKKKAKQMKKKK